MKTKITTVAAVALLISGAAFAQLEVVTNDAGQPNTYDPDCVHDGTFGMKVTTATGTTSAMFVQADAASGFNDETTFRAQFWFNPDDMYLDHGRKHFIMSAIPGTTSKQMAPFRVSFHRNANTGDTKLSFRCKISCADLSCVSAGGGKVTLANDDWNLIQLEWAQNTSAGVWDGVCRISVLDGPAAPQTSEAPMVNRQFNIGGVKMGFLGGTWIHTSTDGSHCYDTFESFRTLAP